MIDRIISYLAQGFSQQKVAEMVGCTQPYVASIATKEDFSSLIQAEKTRLQATQRNEVLEKKYDDLEDKVIAQVKESMPFAEFRDLSRTMEVLIRRKQQQAARGGITVNGNAQFNTVVLSIPQAAAPDITLNSQREVIAIGNKTLAPMQASQVRALFDNIEQQKKLSASRSPSTERMTMTEGIELLRSSAPGSLSKVPEDF